MYVNLKLSIWQAGVRQNRIAQAIKMDEGLLSKIINGFREPTLEQRKSIAAYLQKDEAWLFSRPVAVTKSPSQARTSVS